MLKCETSPDKKLPPFYVGYSYKRWDKMLIVFHVIPLNYVIRFFRHIEYIWNKFRSKPSIIDHILQMEISKIKNEEIEMLESMIKNKINNMTIKCPSCKRNFFLELKD